MDKNLDLLIEKLAHELEEIRTRTLFSIISKLEFGVLKEKDLINRSDIFIKLIDWFDFPSVPCKKEILGLISRLVQDRDGAFYLEIVDPNLSRLSAAVGTEYPEDLAAIKWSLNRVKDFNLHNLSTLPLELGSSKPDDSSSITPSSHFSNRCQGWEYSEVYWPVPQLNEYDDRVLRYVTGVLANKSEALQVVKFFTSVLFNNFPPQVFLYNSSILNTLFKFYEEECDQEVILSCFQDFNLALLRQFKFNLDDASSEVSYHQNQEGDELALCELSGSSQVLKEYLGVGEYSALCLEKFGRRLPSTLRLLQFVIEDLNAFWDTASGAFLKTCISNHLIRLAAEIKSSRACDPLGRLEKQVWLSQVLSALIPEAVSSTVIHQQVQEVLYEELFDASLALLYPNVHKVFSTYVASFQYLEYKKFLEVEMLGESLIGAAKLRCSNGKLPTSQTLALLHLSVPSFDIHQEYHLISLFLKIAAERCLVPSDTELSERILLSLMSHTDDHVKEEVYSELASLVENLLGPTAAQSMDSDFQKIKWIFNPTILKEILNFGITSSLPKVCKAAETMWLMILKSQRILNDENWMILLSYICSCFSYLLAHASFQTSLGRVVLKIFDPDVYLTLNLQKHQVLIGNVCLLFSSDRAVTSEAYSRLLYLLGITSEFNFCMPDAPLLQQTLPSESPFSEESISGLVETLRSAEGKLLKSVVVQISLLSYQASLHLHLLNAGILPLLLLVLQSSLDNVTEHSQETFYAVISTLKNIFLHNALIRNKFSGNCNIYINVLKGLFTLLPERLHLLSTVQLLALLAFSDCIASIDETISFPKIVADNMKLPFIFRVHSDISTYTVSSMKSVLSLNRDACVYLGGLWVSTLGGGPAALFDCVSPPPKPLELLPPESFLHLPTKLENSLSDLMTASSHQAASDAILSLSRYIRLFEWSSEVCSELRWEESVQRYLIITPDSHTDQRLLIGLLRLLRRLIYSDKGQVRWVSNYLNDPSKTIKSVLTATTVKGFTSVQAELSAELLSLVEDCLRFNQEEKESRTALYSVLFQALNISYTQNFYALAIVDGLLRCLLLLPAEDAYCPEVLWKILAVSHSHFKSSFIGLSITRRTLFTINAAATQSKEIKICQEMSWLHNMLSSRDSLVVGATLELACRLSTTPKDLRCLINVFPNLWDLSFRLLMDPCQSTLVQELSAYFCCNIVRHSEYKVFKTDAEEKDFFEYLSRVLAHYKTSKKSGENGVEHSSSEDNFFHHRMSNKLISSLCCLILALMMKDSMHTIPYVLNSGLLHSLARILCEGNFKKVTEKSIVNMYESVLRVLVHAHSSPSNFFPFESLDTLIWILLPSSYENGLLTDGLRVESLRLLSLLVSEESVKELVISKEAVNALAESVSALDPALSFAAASTVAVLAPFLSQDGCSELVKLMGSRDYTRAAVGSILGNSQNATVIALEIGLLPDCLSRLASLQLSLALAPRYSKKATLILENLNMELRLLTNFLAGCNAVKSQAAELGLADYLHKLWVWAISDFGVFSTLLRALITFTCDSPIEYSGAYGEVCDSNMDVAAIVVLPNPTSEDGLLEYAHEAAGTLVLTSTLAGVGQRKSPTSFSLLHSVLNSFVKEVLPPFVKVLLLELISHAFQATECRNIIAKSSFLSEFPSVQVWKKSSTVMGEKWLRVLTVVTSYPEGQSAVTKNDEVMEKLVGYLREVSGAKHQFSVIPIMRNLFFNQVSRQRFLFSTDTILISIGDRLSDLTLSDEELADILLIAWVLAANCHRGKVAARASGLSSKLESALSSRTISSFINDLSQIVLPILNT